MALVLAILLLCAGGRVPLRSEPASLDSAVEYVQIIDNGGFEAAVPADALGAFWLTSRGREGFGIPSHLVSPEQAHSGTYALRLGSSRESVSQYVSAFEPLGDRTTIAASVYLASRPADAASATLTVRDSRRYEIVYVFSEQPRVPEDDATHTYVPISVGADEWNDVTLDYGTDYRDRFGRNPLPRLTVVLGKQDAGTSPVYWDDVRATIALRQMSEAELLDAILAEARWAHGNLLERAIDDIGEPSPYFVKALDAVTGEVLNISPAGGGGPVYNQMLAVLDVRHDVAYVERIVEMADAIVAHLDPVTRLPRRFDPETEELVDGNAIPGPTIDFLLRVHTLTGDETYLHAAEEIGEAILRFAPRLAARSRAFGAVPPNYIPNMYHSATGDPVMPESTYVLHIRWFASPGALIHLYSATGRTDFRDAALASALSYVDHDTVLHYWNVDYPLSPFSFEPTWYDWDRIDPAFDDYFGYGIGGLGGPYAILDIYERTGDERLLSFLDDSLDFMRDVWTEGIHRGGYTFADDARSWQAYYDRYMADPFKYAVHRDVLCLNARNVFRSSQYTNAAWIDARFRLWNPSFPDDRASCPRNLLAALSFAYLVDDRNPIWRAMIASVFETTVAEYKQTYGYVRSVDGVQPGSNAGGIELRFLGELLHHLVPFLEADEA
jgi:hypothetical protein